MTLCLLALILEHSKKVTEESSKTRGSASILTPPINGQRNNQPMFPHRPLPAVSQIIAPVVPAYQRRPAPSADYVANNLKQILASLTSEDRLGSHPSLMYRPHQAYVTPQLPIGYKPAPYTSVKSPMGSSHRVPQAWSSNIWNNRQPSVVTQLSAQASFRHNNPAGMQQVNKNLQPGIVTPLSSEALAQASLRHNTPAVFKQVNANRRPSVVTPLLSQNSLIHQMNSNRPPGVISPLSPQASLRHETLARMQQVNTVGMQRTPFRQSATGQFQRFNALPTPGRSSTQNQNQRPKVSDNINSYGQIHNPIVWHIPLRNPTKGMPGGFRNPFASPIRPATFNSFGQTKHLNFLQSFPVRNRTAGSLKIPYVPSLQQPYLRQQPFLQKQRVNMVPPLQRQNNMYSLPGGLRAQVPMSIQRHQQQQQQKQQSLAYKMALLDSNEVPQTNVPATLQLQKQVPFTQLPSMRPSSGNHYPRPPYSPNAQQRVLPVSPFSPHYIYGQHSWPWGGWRNQASPVALASSRSSGLSLPQTFGRNPQRYQTTTGFAPKSPISPYAVSPKVLLYYYFYPRTITRPLMKLTNLREDKLKGSFWQKLRDEISSAAVNNKPGAATLTRNPTVTGQTQAKSTVAQTEHFQTNMAPYGAFKLHTPYIAPYYKLVSGSSKAPLARGMVAGRLANQLQGGQQAQAPLLQTQLGQGMRQMSYLPMLRQQSSWTSPNAVQLLKVMTQPQTPVNTQLPLVGDRRSQLTKGLLNRPIYIQTVPYQLYNLLQQMPLFNTQSGTQQYLSRVLSDILRLRYVNHKKKKKKRGAKEGKIITTP